MTTPGADQGVLGGVEPPGAATPIPPGQYSEWTEFVGDPATQRLWWRFDPPEDGWVRATALWYSTGSYSVQLDVEGSLGFDSSQGYSVDKLILVEAGTPVYFGVYAEHDQQIFLAMFVSDYAERDQLLQPAQQLMLTVGYTGYAAGGGEYDAYFNYSGGIPLYPIRYGWSHNVLNYFITAPTGSDYAKLHTHALTHHGNQQYGGLVPPGGDGYFATSNTPGGSYDQIYTLATGYGAPYSSRPTGPTLVTATPDYSPSDDAHYGVGTYYELFYDPIDEGVEAFRGSWNCFTDDPADQGSTVHFDVYPYQVSIQAQSMSHSVSLTAAYDLATENISRPSFPPAQEVVGEMTLDNCWVALDRTATQPIPSGDYVEAIAHIFARVAPGDAEDPNHGIPVIHGSSDRGAEIGVFPTWDLPEWFEVPISIIDAARSAEASSSVTTPRRLLIIVEAEENLTPWTGTLPVVPIPSPGAYTISRRQTRSMDHQLSVKLAVTTPEYWSLKWPEVPYVEPPPPPGVFTIEGELTGARARFSGTR